MLLFLSLFFSAISAFAEVSYETVLRVDGFESNKIITATGNYDVIKNEVLAIRSKSKQVGIIGYARVVSIRKGKPTHYRLELVRQSKYNLVQVGDLLLKFDLSSETDGYMGSTELLVRENAPQISARFKPLFTQGIAIGETAQSLWKDEFLLTWYGQLHYGVVDWLSVGTLVPGNFLDAPNVSLKAQFLDTATESVASGVTASRVPGSSRWVFNWNLMWDSFSKESMVSHMFVTLAIVSIEKAEDSTAIKSAGTSSIQSGHEYILDNWSRVLFGPNYNFEARAIGGYLAYVKIWDNFHLQGTIYSTNVQEVKWNVNDGYFAYIDAYWRF